MDQRPSLPQLVLEKLDSHKQINGHSLTTYTKVNSKCPKALNIRHETIKLLEETIDKIFSDINHTNVFLDQSPKTIEIKAKIHKWDLIKLKSFCRAKETIYIKR